MAEHQVDQDRSTNSLERFNVALRGLMELGIVIGLGYWGYQVGSTLLLKILLAILMPLFVFGFWGLVDFHQAGSLAEPLRLLQELTVCGLTAVALYTVGRHTLGWAMVLIAVVYHALVYLSGARLLPKYG
jgi:hypothetical protein